MSVPDYPLGQTLDFKFTSRAFATGVPTTLAGTPVIEVYENNDLAQITVGETLTVDFDAVTGLNNLRIIATSGNGYEVGKSYHAVISTGTVDGTSVVGEVVAQFSIERSAALMPTVTGRKLDVTTTGEAGLDLGNVTGVLGNADVSWIDGSNRVDLGRWLTVAPNVLIGNRVDSHTGNMAANVVTSAAIATGAVDADALATDTITAAKIAANAIGSSELATGAITSAQFAAGAIDAAAIAANAIGASELATDAIGSAQLATTAVDEIADGVWDEDATGHQTLGTFGQAIGDPVANAETMYEAVVTDAAGANVAADIIAIQSDTDDIQTRLPAALVGGAMDSDVSAIQANAITASAIATDAITAAKIAANAIGASELATDAIGSDQLAATAVQEIADAVLPPTNTALSNVEFLMVDDTDHITPKTGLTVTGTRSIDGAAFTGVSGTIAEVGNGIYQFDALAADMNGGIITFRFASATADDTFITIRTAL